MRAVLLLCVGVVVAGCHVLPDSRCSEENCRAAVESCRQVPAGTPNLGQCVRAGLVFPENYFEDRGLQRCSDACNEQDMGETLSCIAHVAPQCDAVPPSTTDRSAEFQRIVEEECTTEGSFGSSGSVDPDCDTECWTHRTECEAACPTDSWDACEACAADCGLAWARCNNAC